MVLEDGDAFKQVDSFLYGWIIKVDLCAPTFVGLPHPNSCPGCGSLCGQIGLLSYRHGNGFQKPPTSFLAFFWVTFKTPSDFLKAFWASIGPDIGGKGLRGGSAQLSEVHKEGSEGFRGLFFKQKLRLLQLGSDPWPRVSFWSEGDSRYLWMID